MPVSSRTVMPLIAEAGAASTQRAITAQFLDVDGSPLTRQQQLIHWWTSTAQTGSVAAPIKNTYTVVSGSNVVPLTTANSGSTIHHAVTDSSGKFTLRFTNTGGGTDQTIWFNTEVQGIIYSISTTVNDGTPA